MLHQVRERGALRVATLDAPSTYYAGREGAAGFEHDLVSAYAQSIGVRAEFSVYTTSRGLLAALERGEADLAAAGLTVTRDRLAQVRFGPSYRVVEEVVVCHRSTPDIPDVTALAQVSITIEAGSAHEDALRQLEAEREGLELDLTLDPTRSWLEILERVSLGVETCTVLDDTDFTLHRRYMPNLRGAVRLPEPQTIAWALAGGRTFRADRLDRSLERWFRSREARDLLETLNERYFGFEPHAVTDGHAAELRRAIERKLPRYEALFRSEAERANVPWTLLAAVAYQESHWNPRARSPTGVRGMMMLTLPTAQDLGVTNRLNVDQSVRGGARYLRRLYDQLPDTIEPGERWWFACAAYNIGMGHLLDARTLTRRAGADPDVWANVRDHLHRLEDPDQVEDLRFGVARGREAQLYVRRVRDYADVLEKLYAPPVTRPAVE